MTISSFETLVEQITQARSGIGEIFISKQFHAGIGNDKSAIQAAISTYAQSSAWFLIPFSVSSLREITISEAQTIITACLYQDWAYHTTIVPYEHALEMARSFLSFFSSQALLFTNGRFAPLVATSIRMTGWTPETTATFDTGVIVVDKKSIGCLWVKDED